MRQQKHILVSVIHKGVLHWRLVSAYRVGKRWEIPQKAYNKMLKDIGHTGMHRIIVA